MISKSSALRSFTKAPLRSVTIAWTSMKSISVLKVTCDGGAGVCCAADDGGPLMPPHTKMISRNRES